MRRRFRIRARFYLLLLCAMLVVFSTGFGLSGLKIHRQEKRIAQLQQEKRAQEARLLQLEKALEFAQTDACVEKIARSRLNLLYPGEVRYIAG